MKKFYESARLSAERKLEVGQKNVYLFNRSNKAIDKQVLFIDDLFVADSHPCFFQIVEFIAYIIIPIVITLFVVIYWAVGFVQYNNPNF